MSTLLLGRVHGATDDVLHPTFGCHGDIALASDRIGIRVVNDDVFVLTKQALRYGNAPLPSVQGVLQLGQGEPWFTNPPTRLTTEKPSGAMWSLTNVVFPAAKTSAINQELSGKDKAIVQAGDPTMITSTSAPSVSVGNRSFREVTLLSEPTTLIVVSVQLVTYSCGLNFGNS